MANSKLPSKKKKTRQGDGNFTKIASEQPFLQLPLPSHDDIRLYEEWLKKKQQEEEQSEKDEHVIIIDM